MFSEGTRLTSQCVIKIFCTDDYHAQSGEHNAGPECAERRFAGCHFLNQDSQKRQPPHDDQG